MGSLEGRIALVAGATRGAGRGIAVGLGEQGATVYCTGRSVRGGLASGPGRPETIDETAERTSVFKTSVRTAIADETDPERRAALLELCDDLEDLQLRIELLHQLIEELNRSGLNDIDDR